MPPKLVLAVILSLVSLGASACATWEDERVDPGAAKPWQSDYPKDGPH